LNKKLAVIIIDDDDNYRETLSDILSFNDWDIDTASDGYKAINMVRQKQYDVALLDVNMPGIDGVETFKELKKIRPDMIVFMMTANNIDPLKNLLEKGVSTIMQKPFNVEEVVKMISGVRKKAVVLIVDDSEADRSTLSEILSAKGFDVLAASQGLEALETLKTKDVDVVLLDVRLPDMDGVTVLERMKKIKPTLSIIAITGYSLDGIIDTMSKKGVYTCLLKPFDIELLINEINTLVDRKVAESERETDDLLPEILLVEDNDSIRQTMAAILEEQNYNVKAAASLDEALALVDKEYFNLVISDLSLGDASGLSLVEPVRKKDASTIFLLVTGAGSMETALEAIKKDVDEYILKPVEPGELVHKVKTYLEKQKMKKEKEKLVNQLEASNTKLLELVKIDELTTLFNRRYLFEQLHAEMQRAKRQHKSLALMMCDVDGFKIFNDKNGHIEGDRLLKEIAFMLKASVRQFVDQVFRYGGDEFSIVVPEIDLDSAMRLAERVVSKVVDGLKGKGVGISIGVAVYSEREQDMSLNELIHAADKKLYESKRAGGKRATG